MRNILVLLFMCMNLYSQTSQIFVDENFDDWSNVQDYYDDENDDLTFDMDFKRLWMTNDSNYVFMRLDFYNNVLIQEDSNATVFINTDNDFSTGSKELNSGAEIKFNFGKHIGYYFFDNDSMQIYQNDLKYISAPTVSTTSLEFSFKLDNEINGSLLFSSDTMFVKFINYYSKKDEIPNQGMFFKYVINRDLSANYKEIDLSRNNPSDIRIVSYNVHRDDIFLEEKQNSFNRIFNAIKPDIIAFQEIYNHSSTEVANIIESFLPSEANGVWYHSKIEPIDDNPYNVTDNIVISKYPIIDSFRIQGWVYEQYGVDQSNAAYLIDLPDNEKNLLLIVAHPPCCRNYYYRQIELQEIMSFIRDAKELGGAIDLPKNTPIIISGDLNLVGPVYERSILIDGQMIDHSIYGENFNPDWDNTSFTDARPYTTGFPGVITWYNETDLYSPGRLDYFIYSDYTLSLENSFSLFTKTIPKEILQNYNLELNDNLIASDHLPLVCDFSLTNVVGLINNNLPNDFTTLYQNYPNPFNPSTEIKYYLANSGKVKITVYDILGKEIAVLFDGFQVSGYHNINFNAQDLASGIYYYSLKTVSFNGTEKMLLIR